MIVGHRFMDRVSPRFHIPPGAVLISALIPAVIVFMPTATVARIITFATVGIYFAFQSVVLASLIARSRLTTLMVTHSMNQAASLGDRLVMMAGGRVRLDLSGAEKKRVRAGELVERFEEIQREERLDESAADVLRRQYV